MLLSSLFEPACSDILSADNEMFHTAASSIVPLNPLSVGFVPSEPINIESEDADRGRLDWLPSRTPSKYIYESFVSNTPATWCHIPSLSGCTPEKVFRPLLDM